MGDDGNYKEERKKRESEIRALLKEKQKAGFPHRERRIEKGRKEIDMVCDVMNRISTNLCSSGLFLDFST